jgi:hypothetical protein
MKFVVADKGNIYYCTGGKWKGRFWWKIVTPCKIAVLSIILSI